MDFVKRVWKEVTVEPILFLYMFGNFLYVPVFQSLIFDKVCLAKFDSNKCSHLRDDHDDPNYHDVNSETSHWILMTNIALTIPSAVAVLLFYGALGDKIGRKVPVIIPCFGAFAAYIAGMLNAHFMTGSIHFLLIGPILNGSCGGFIAMLMSVYSYVGHKATERSKMSRISAVEASVFIAGTVGIFVSGVILDQIGYEYTFLVILACVTLALIYSLVCLKNVKTNQQMDTNKQSCSGVIAAYVRESVQCVGKKRNFGVFSSILLQVLCLNVLMFCTTGDIDICFIYLRERLGYSQVLYGYYKGLDSFLRGIILFIIPRLVKRYFNTDDFLLVLVGIGSYAVSFGILAFASTKWMAFLAAVVGMFKGFPAAGLRTKMSSLVDKNEQGRLFGLTGASESITTLFASLVFNSVYPSTYSAFPGLCYLLAVVLLVLAFVLVLFIKARYPTQEEEDTDSNYSQLSNSVEIHRSTNDDAEDRRQHTGPV